jgi:uncharacterized protein (DUF952 family)
VLLHIISDADLRAARLAGEIAPETLAAEGFVHCSFGEQVLIPANERYRGRADLVLVVLDRDRILHEVIVEDSYATGHEFPHVYGPIPLEAIVTVVRFPPNPDGTFALPPLQ